MSAAYLKVSATEAARRRAGYDFGKVPVYLDLAELSLDQIETLEADPILKVTRATDEEVAAMLEKLAAIPASDAPVMPHNIRDLDPGSEGSVFFGDGVYARYGQEILSLPLTGDPVADCTTFFDEVALFAEKTGLAEAAQLSQASDQLRDQENGSDGAGDPAADLASNQENISALAGNAADAGKAASGEKSGALKPVTSKTAKAKGGGA